MYVASKGVKFTDHSLLYLSTVRPQTFFKRDNDEVNLPIADQNQKTNLAKLTSDLSAPKKVLGMDNLKH